MAIDIRAEVEKALDVAAKVAESPLAQAALSVVYVPPSVTAKVGELLGLLDAELAKFRVQVAVPPVLPSATSPLLPSATSPVLPADPKVAATDGGPSPLPVNVTPLAGPAADGDTP